MVLNWRHIWRHKLPKGQFRGYDNNIVFEFKYRLHDIYTFIKNYRRTYHPVYMCELYRYKYHVYMCELYRYKL